MSELGSSLAFVLARALPVMAPQKIFREKWLWPRCCVEWRLGWRRNKSPATISDRYLANRVD